MTALHINSLAGIILFSLYVTATLMIPKTRKFTINHMLGLMLGTYGAGFLLYLWGFWHGASNNFFTASLRAAVAALEMFASRNSLIEVSEELKEENIIYMIIFSLVHFQAAMLTLVLIIDMFGKRLHSRILADFLYFGARKKKLIIFDGAEESSKAIASSIPADPANLIIFIRSVLDPEVKSVSLFDVLLRNSRKRSATDEFEALGYVLITPVSLSEALCARKGWVYSLVRMLINKCSSAEIFLTSWGSETNADAAYTLSEDLPDGLDVHIYTGVNIAMPHAQKLMGKKYVCISSRSSYVVEDLCKNTPLLSGGSRGRTLIIGFGRTARRCIEILCEEEFRQIDVVAPEVRIYSEEFLCFHPDLRDMEGLRFYSYATRSNDFWTYLFNNISSISNVIVFGQDKAANYNIAAQILRYAKTVIADTDGFRVYLMEDSGQAGDDAPGMYTFGKTEDIYSYTQITK